MRNYMIEIYLYIQGFIILLFFRIMDLHFHLGVLLCMSALYLCNGQPYSVTSEPLPDCNSKCVFFIKLPF